MWILPALAFLLCVSFSHAKYTPERIIKGKLAAVTGAGSGLAKAVAKKLLDEGAKVIVIDANSELCKQAAATFKEQYGDDKCACVVGNVFDDLDRVEATIYRNFGELDILMNMATVIDEKHPEAMIDFNIRAKIKASSRLYENTRKDKGGKGALIINLVDVVTQYKDSFLPVFKGSSATVQIFGETLGHPYRYKDTGVAVIGICAGYTDTPQHNTQMEVDEYANIFDTYTDATFPFQTVDEFVSGVMTVIKNGESGISYNVEGGRVFKSPNVVKISSAEDIEAFEKTSNRRKTLRSRKNPV